MQGGKWPEALTKPQLVIHGFLEANSMISPFCWVLNEKWIMSTQRWLHCTESWRKGNSMGPMKTLPMRLVGISSSFHPVVFWGKRKQLTEFFNEHQKRNQSKVWFLLWASVFAPKSKARGLNKSQAGHSRPWWRCFSIWSYTTRTENANVIIIIIIIIILGEAAVLLYGCLCSWSWRNNCFKCMDLKCG